MPLFARGNKRAANQERKGTGIGIGIRACASASGFLTVSCMVVSDEDEDVEDVCDTGTGTSEADGGWFHRDGLDAFLAREGWLICVCEVPSPWLYLNGNKRHRSSSSLFCPFAVGAKKLKAEEDREERRDSAGRCRKASSRSLIAE